MSKASLLLVSALLIAPQLQADDSFSGFRDLNTCKQVAPLLQSTSMQSESLYQMSQGVCQEIVPQQAGGYFSDNQCANAIQYEAQSPSEYCAEALDTERFGDGAYTPEEQVWRQHPAMTLDIGVESLEGNFKPFEARSVYKTINSDRGTCQLEMRIYKRNVGKTGLKPLIFFHGGSWNSRQGGMVGLQSQLSHYTDEGFLVFTPFYRLTGTDEGGAACNGVTGDAIVEDANSALDWVVENAAEYGGSVSSSGVLVAGQSAGGHLAASLAVHRPDQVARALLFYPPTDFPAVIGEWLANGIGANTQGVAAVEGFVGSSFETVDLSSELVRTNTFPEVVAGKQGVIPPIFMLHGDADGLVPVSQSARLCNSLSGGDAENGPATDLTMGSGEAKKIIECDSNDSQLHAISGADHVLDVCIDLGLEAFGIDSFCPAGNAEGQAAVKKSLQEARSWLTGGAAGTTDADGSGSGERENPDTTVAGDANTRSSSGGGSIGVFMLMPFFLRRVLLLKRFQKQ